MTAITDAEFEEAAALAPEVVRRYLSGKGWNAERDLSGAELWEWRPPHEPGPPYELLVPVTRRRDYAGRVADILEALAVVEARRPGDILREMRLPPVDWQFLRLVPPGPSGTAPLLDLVSALSGLKDLHTAAASSAHQPQAVQPGQKPQVVKDHVAAVRLDQTRVGSYVIAAHTPLPEGPYSGYDRTGQRSLFDEAAPAGRSPLHPQPSEPFARRISRMLYAGVACAHAAAEATLADDSVPHAEHMSGAGLSANLCEALVRIAGEERRDFSLSFAWSSEMPMEQPSPPVGISHRHVGALDAVAKDLRERLGREEGAVLNGVVTKLHRDVNPREATIYGSFLQDDTLRQRRVRVELRAEDVDRAAEAWRRGLEVTVAGDLEPRGTGVRMRGVTRFVVRPE
ncbi:MULTISPECIES: hypothetical protein [Streptomyces]|uniref:Uncharacterized protein n=1 Tax=Streptomyces edwardsiae TaxID=3075527 RepID=A0ABU2PPR9_9ACTN|nr:hypothetical protein [Streptomyces sp. DSM 41636]MDT0394135.1 hypothetical protein [Streptomyces sp. DSM 41636]